MDFGELIDLKDPAKQICLVTQGGEQNYSFLVISSLFKPSRETRYAFQFEEDLSHFKNAEHYLHYKYLLLSQKVDGYSYKIPIHRYHPSVLKYVFFRKFLEEEKEEDKEVVHFVSPLLMTPEKNPDKNSTPQIVILLNKQCSAEEQLSLKLFEKNPDRPDIEEGVLVFKYLWKYRNFDANYEAFMLLQQKFWERFLGELGSKKQ